MKIRNNIRQLLKKLQLTENINEKLENILELISDSKYYINNLKSKQKKVDESRSSNNGEKNNKYSRRISSIKIIKELKPQKTKLKLKIMKLKKLE